MTEAEEMKPEEKTESFELFKSNVCHRVKELGDVVFLIRVIKQDQIRKYYEEGKYAESFYLLAMTDYLSRLNNFPLCSEYDDLRKQKLSEPLYPTGILLAAQVEQKPEIKEQALRHAIPEFLHFNIIENNIRDVA
jgi:hypothetical protein